MDSESLIKQIKQYPVLYDQNHGKYRNTDYKDRIWRDISISLGAKGGVAECKRKWSSIRDQYRKIIYKRKKFGTSTRNKKYIYENILSFLHPYMVNKETGISLLESNGENNEEENSNPAQTTKKARGRPPQKNQIKGKFFAPLARKRIFAKRKFNVDKDTMSTQLMAYILEEKRAKQISNEIENHPVDVFLAGIAPTLKTLSPMLLNQVKSKIFAVVQEFEIRELMGNQEYDQESTSSYISTSMHEGEILLEEINEDFKGSIAQFATVE